MKPTKIKVWPELLDYLPSLPVLREPKANLAVKQPIIEVDFGSVRSVSSTGLTVFLLRLLRFLGKGRTPHIQHGCLPAIQMKLDRLRAFEHLGSIVGTIQHELPIGDDHLRAPRINESGEINFPIYRLTFEDGIDRRRSVSKFKAWLSEQLSPVFETYSVPTNGIVMLLGEIAKNTADHANSDALFGADVFLNDDSTSRFSFAFGDLGIGIKQHIEQHLPPEYEKRRRHMSLYEAYKLALTPGYTSNRSTGLNAGHGMSIIIDCTIDLGLHLSVFDASSRGLLSNFEGVERPSHAAIRRIFHNVGHDLGFFYFGECNLKRKKV